MMTDDVMTEGRRVADVLPLIGAVALDDGTPLPLYDCDSFLGTDAGWALRASGDLAAYRAARARWEALRDETADDGRVIAQQDRQYGH